MSGVVAAVATGGSAGLSASVPSGTYSHYVIDPLDANTTLQFNTDGTCSVSAGVTPPAANWEGGPGTGSDYDISFDGGGNWNNLSVARSITVSRTVVGMSQATFDTRIRRTSDGVTVATGSITLEATVDA